MFIAILFLLAIGIVALFSAQNAKPVEITFLFWNFDASLAIVIFLSVMLGIVIGMAILSFIRFKYAGKTKKDINTKQENSVD